MKMKMEAVEQSRNKIDEELSELKMGQKFIIGERDKLKEDYEELKKKMEETQKKLDEAEQEQGERNATNRDLKKTQKDLERKKTQLEDVKERNKVGQESYEKIRSTLEYERG